MQYHCNAELTGDYSAEAGNIVPNNELKWKCTTGSEIFSSPAVADSIVYVCSNDGNMYALDATTGAKIWNYTIEEAVPCSPAVSNGVVYFGGSDYYVYAVDAQTHQLKWKYSVGFFPSDPTVANGVVYVGSWNSIFYALNANTGLPIWKFKTGDNVYRAAAVSSGVVYVGSSDKNVYAIVANNHTLLWKFTTSSWTVTSPAIANGLVYVGAGYPDNKLYALNGTNTPMWIYSISNPSDPTVANGVVYIGSATVVNGTPSGDFCALNALTGKPMWSYTTGDWIFASPAIAAGTVFGASTDGNLYALDAITGHLNWQYATGPVLNTPAVVDGVIFVGSCDHNVYAIGNQRTCLLTLNVSSDINHVNHPVTMKGRFTFSDTRITDARVTLQVALVRPHQLPKFTDITTTPTNSEGEFYFRRAENTVGDYLYRIIGEGSEPCERVASRIVKVKVID